MLLVQAGLQITQYRNLRLRKMRAGKYSCWGPKRSILSPQRNLIAIQFPFRNEVQPQSGEHGLGRDWTKLRMMQHSPSCGSVTNIVSMRWRTFSPLREFKTMCIPCKPMRCRRTVDLGRQRRRLTCRFRIEIGGRPRYEMRVSGGPDAWFDNHRFL